MLSSSGPEANHHLSATLFSFGSEGPLRPWVWPTLASLIFFAAPGGPGFTEIFIGTTALVELR